MVKQGTYRPVGECYLQSPLTWPVFRLPQLPAQNNLALHMRQFYWIAHDVDTSDTARVDLNSHDRVDRTLKPND